MNHRILPLAASLALVACAADPAFEKASCDDVEGTCLEFSADEPQALLDAVNTLDSDTTLVLGAGTFLLDNQVTIRAEGITVMGQGMGETVLDFSAQEAQSNGIDVVGDRFTVEHLTVLDAKKDGIRIEDSDRILIHGVEATWSNAEDSTNGAYGIYPVKVTNVTLEESVASNSSDAGIYVGQCQHAIVRNNVATGNVAGIEIENTQYADVYGNTATNNTGGLVVFDLPGNPIVGRDIKIHDNVITDNNTPNFGPSGTVRSIPAGTGTFAMASRRVEIYDNTYANNGTTDIAIISGLAIESDPTSWAHDPTVLVGTWQDLGLYTDPDSGAVFNFSSTEVHIHDNTHSGSGTLVDGGTPDNDCLVDPSSDACTRPLGILLQFTYGGTPVDEILYDAIGESAFDPAQTSGNSNDNHLCVGPSTEATLGSLNLPALAEAFPPSIDMLYRPASAFAPFDCTGFTGGPIGEIVVETP